MHLKNYYIQSSKKAFETIDNLSEDIVDVANFVGERA